MKITYQDKKDGVIELLPEILDDLWHLSHIIQVGDTITSKTTRRIQDTTGDKIRSDRGVKKTFTLDVKIETISFHMFTGKLRLTGIITKGPEDLIPIGSHHTIEAKLNTPIKITKDNWDKWSLKRINQAIESSKKLSAIIICIEDNTADIGLIRQYGVEYYGPILGNISGKRNLDKNRGKTVREFYNTIIETIERFNNISTYIIAGPGFYKNDFLKFLQEKHKDLSKKAILENTGTGGRTGIQEILKKGVIEKLTTENRIGFEISQLNKAFEEMSKQNPKVVYGVEEVKKAANLGAVDKLLILDTIIREKDFESTMDLVENMSGKVTVISSEHEGGEQLKGLGGAIAWLRYSI